MCGQRHLDAPTIRCVFLFTLYINERFVISDVFVLTFSPFYRIIKEKYSPKDDINMFLENINSPDDVKKLSLRELSYLADEMRKALIFRLSRTGGHVGSNLGVVELAAALHYVFSSPFDKIVWDVSHQCYAHKMLTGRKDAYTNPECFHDVTGYTNPCESEHDFFTVGHTATSIPLALGLAKGRDMCAGDENIIAVIGDGALSGGEAYEGLNIAGEYCGNLIIIVNDNEQSVAENHGGLYKGLAKLRESGGTCQDNIFRSLGLDYVYLEEGNDTKKLVKALQSIKNCNHPVVLHIHTVKGKGLEYAEKDRESWHSGAPFNVCDGSPKNGYPVYDTTVHDSLTDMLTRDKNSAVLTAGTPRALGFVANDRAMWTQTGRFIDVGIAEECAVAYASGLAKYGASAVFGVYAPFLQRSYDQISHDLCLNNNPATILVLLPGVYGMKSNTHLGLCDIQMLTHIPNLVYLDPCSRQEYNEMLKYTVTERNHPTAIRVPVRFRDETLPYDTDYSVLNKARVHCQGKGAAVISTGMLLPTALECAKICREKYSLDITVITPRYLTGTDDALLEELKNDHSLILTIEDGELDGGYGMRIASYYGMSDMRVRNFGISKKFHSDFNAEALLCECGISAESLAEFIKDNLR